MGFIKDNTNTFTVYLTDFGKQKYLEGGLKDSIVYFSLSDNTNYNIFTPNIDEIPPFDAVTASSGLYNVGDYVLFNTKYYKLKNHTTSSVTPNLNMVAWELVKVFNAKSIDPQSIAVINHGPSPSYKTSLPDSSTSISDVFTQPTLRGTEYINVVKLDYKLTDGNINSATDIDIDNSKSIRRAILGIKNNTFKNYLVFESDLNNEDLSLLTYTEVFGTIPNFN